MVEQWTDPALQPSSLMAPWSDRAAQPPSTRLYNPLSIPFYNRRLFLFVAVARPCCATSFFDKMVL